jgi:hypothetical protein
VSSWVAPMALASAKIDCGHATKAISLFLNLNSFSSRWITSGLLVIRPEFSLKICVE